MFLKIKDVDMFL